ncbi:MAG: hypothetical protein MUE82_01130 [Chloroflexi bacterium]|jgi:hypothetical protein|nr:hypothetical protein [Chloroflexota bacterium]
MRRSIKVASLLGAMAVAGVVVPTVAAAIAKQRAVIIDDPEAPEIALSTIFEGVEVENRSPEFRGGTTVCWYGAQQLDLRGATLAPDGAALRARCIFGGLQVLVPETWRVQVRSIPVFGGVQDSSSGPDGEGPLLTIEAVCVFGGVSIDTHDEDAWGVADRA